MTDKPPPTVTLPAIPIPPSTLMAPVFTSPRVLSVVFVKDETPTKVETPVTTKSSRSVRPSTSKSAFRSTFPVTVKAPPTVAPTPTINWEPSKVKFASSSIVDPAPTIGILFSVKELILTLLPNVEIPVTFRSSNSV